MSEKEKKSPTARLGSSRSARIHRLLPPRANLTDDQGQPREVPPPFLPFLGGLGASVGVLVSLWWAFSMSEGSFPQKKSVRRGFGVVLVNSS
jgi:hypothetical protein